MTRFLSTLLVLHSTLFVYAQTAPKAAEYVNENAIFTVVEKKPMFVGGDKKMWEYIKTTLHIPKKIYETKMEGKVAIEFIIEPDGSISNLAIKKSMGFECDDEATRIIKAMPKWQAGQNQGRNVRTLSMLLIPFSYKSINYTEVTDRTMSRPDWYLPAYRRQ